MIDFILNRNTLTVLLDAKNMQSYDSGIFPVSNCKEDTASHVGQIVGVNVEGGYWIIRNTWGPGWGEKGYLKLAIVSTNPFKTLLCLLNEMTLYSSSLSSSTA